MSDVSTSWEGAPQGQDRPEIVASWARCLGRDGNFQQRSLPHAEYDDDSPLVRAARQPLSNLADEIEGLPGGIVVADDRGVIVASAPCSTTGRRALEGIEMVPGADFSERSVGTNGVGTALAAKRPVLVAAQEHLRPAFSEYICVGVPLTHPRTRQVMGVVELTTTLLDLQKANGLIRYTLDRAARRIERTVGALNAGSAMLLAELFDEREAKTVDPLVGVAPRGRAHERGIRVRVRRSRS